MSDQTRIEMYDATINPFGWGCYGPGGDAEHVKLCSYCFAKRLSQRKMNTCLRCQAFIPHWHPEQLEKPLHWKRSRRIFVQSMGDPFGPRVTQREMHAVFDTMARAPQHTYYLLTKQPQNILGLLEGGAEYWPQVWIGASVDTQARADASWQPMTDVMNAGWHTFASVEPMLTPVNPGDLNWADWVIVGAQTGAGADKHQPDRKWVEFLIRELHVPVFLKSSITKLWPGLTRREWPGRAE